MRGYIGILISIILLVSYASLYSQETISISRLSSALEFDGRPFEDTWEGIANLSMVQNKPNFGTEPSEKSEVKVAYDNEFLWVGAKLYMNDATKIFVSSKKRDAEPFGFDAFGVLLDSYNDNENGLAFYTNPTGLRTEYAISNDGTDNGGGRQGPPGFGSLNFSWNTFWDVKTSRDAQGWYVEMRIPFSSIRFKPQDDKAIMGLLIVRTISANSEVDTWPAVDPKYGFISTNKPSLAASIEFEGVRPSKPVYITPYVIGGFSRNRELNELGTEYISEDKPKLDAGIDIKYSINSNLTLDLTANTDFAQVEADDQQVNLTRYSLFFPEKRVFFQERSSIFSFGLGGMSDLFYSRNIGISENGPIRIYGGARLTGRMGKWDMGFLDMQTEEQKETPGENFGVLRMRRQVINPNSYVGGIFTSRIGMNGKQNYAYGLDGIFKVFKDDYMTLRAAQTYNSEIDNKPASLDPSFLMVQWERRSEKGFAYNVNYSYNGQQFNPGIGFVMRPAIQGFNGVLLYGWMPGEKSKWFSIVTKVIGERYTRIADGGLENMRIMPNFEFQTKKDYGGELTVEFVKEGVNRDFPLSDSISVTAGNYSFVSYGLELRTPMSKKVSTFVEFKAGEFYDGNRYGIMTGPMFNISSSLQLTTFYTFDALRFPDRETNNKLNIHSINVKALYMMSTKLTASVMGQYVNTEDDFVFNFRLRYNPREGNDFYIVYNEFRGLNGHEEIPTPPSYFNRTIMLKYTYTFRL